MNTNQTSTNPAPKPPVSNPNPPANKPNNSYTGRGENLAPPSACKYCSEWYFHSQCDRNPYRRDRNGPNEGQISREKPTPRENPKNEDANRNVKN